MKISVMSKLKFAINGLLLFLIILISTEALSAVDINNSYDTDIKIFGNCKVSIINLKDGKKFVSLEMLRNIKMFFRILFDKSKPVLYQEVGTNDRGWKHGLEQRGNVDLFIGDRSYNIPARIRAHNSFLITTFFDMPNDFLKLAKNNKFFTIKYPGVGVIPDPIILDGFNQALQYAKQLQKRI